MSSTALPPALASRAWRNSQNPQLTRERLQRFEEGLPLPLPSDFRDVLVAYNGVHLGPCSTGLRDALGDEVHIDELLGLHDHDWTPLRRGGTDIPMDILVFTQQRGSVNRFGLQLADRPDSPRGTVWFFDINAETETSDLYVPSACAASFGEFLSRLVPLPEDPRFFTPPSDEPTPPESPEKRPADVPTPQKPLVLAGHGHTVEDARLDIRVTTRLRDEGTSAYRYQPDRATAQYDLELRVDSTSDEDGRPAPYASAMPVTDANQGRHPTLAEWPGLVVGQEEPWDAWYGTDAPSLGDNRLTVLERSGADLQVRWEARYSWAGRDLPFLFEGRVRIGGIRFDVASPEDIDRVLASAFGGRHQAGEWIRIVGEQKDRGPQVPEEGRYVFPVKLIPR
ncbi:SMI1/KNR4 family protein [Myxococcus fulvus]|uniref:SMI1/KNR4 family protein n=1 Tax=Myxococcus fulvus TaxID=33 RepID=UPI003B9B6B2A